MSTTPPPPFPPQGSSWGGPPQGPPQGPPPGPPYGWQPPKRRRTGLWIGLGVGGLVVLSVLAIVIVLLVTKDDDDTAADDDDSSETSETPEASEPPTPGLLSYHRVVGEVPAGSEPSAEENMVLTDEDTGTTWELGPAVIDETDVRDAHAREYPELGEGIWVIDVTLTDEAHDAFIDYITDLSCATSAPDNQLAFVIEEELGYAGEANVPCGTDTDSDPVLNGYYSEDEAKTLADELQAAGEDG